MTVPPDPVGSGPPRLSNALYVAAMVPAILVAIFLWLAAQFDAQGRMQAEVVKSQALQRAIADVISDMKDAETGQRGFVITGNPAFLEPYRTARQAIGARSAGLQALSAGQSPDIRRHVDEIVALIPRKLAEMENVLAVRAQSGPDAAAVVVSRGVGKRLMDRIRDETRAVQRLQDADLARRVAADRREARLNRLLFELGMMIATAIAFVVACMTWNSNRARHKAMLDTIDASVRQTAIFRNALNAIVLINPSGSIEIMNPAAERLFGYPATDLLRRDIAIVADLAPGDGPFLERIGLGPDGLAAPYRSPFQARRADGSTVPVEVALGVMRLEDGVHIVATFSDLTEREKAERIKDQFLSTVSHELRTPLTSIVGALGLVKSGAAPAGSQALRLLDIAENNANRLIRIVNDILDAEKLQSGEMSFDKVRLDLREVVRGAAGAMAALAATRTIRVEVECPAEPVMVHGDSDRLVQVVTNLLANAIKFSPPGTRVQVKLAPNGACATVAVADEGPGIPAGFRDRLFTRFAQSPGTSHSGMPGTGLGLAIAMSIVRAHDGRIRLDDNIPVGSVFTVELPLHSSQVPVPGPAGGAKLLLLTNAGEADALRAAFAALDIQVDVVAGVEEAQRTAVGGGHLAFVLDVRVVGERARDIVGAIRASPVMAEMPIIGIASDADRSPPGAEAAIDIVDWLPAPLTAQRIRQAITAARARATAACPLVLHVDDDSDTLQVAAAALSGIARVEQAPDLATARAFLAANAIDILVVDIALPDGSGLDLVGDSGRRGIPVIIYSAQDARSDLEHVEAVLIKSRNSLPNLVDSILTIHRRKCARGGDAQTA